MAQKIVNMKQAFGVEGEFYDSSIKRATNYKLSADAAVGKPVFLKADGTIIPVGTDATAANYLGFAVNPKEHINFSGLGATLEVKSGKYVGVADVGRVIVKVATAAKVGDKVFVCKTHAEGGLAVGELAAGASAPSTGTFLELANARFDIVDAKAGELAVVRLG